MNLETIRKRVESMVPGLTDVRLELSPDKAGVYFLCTRDGKTVCVFCEKLTYGLWVSLRTDEQMAIEIARWLRV